MVTDHLPNRKSQYPSLPPWSTRPKPPRTQNKSSPNNSKRSKVKHPSYQSRENKPIQKLRFWNKLSSKVVSAQSLTGHRLWQNSMPMLVAKSLLVASKSMSCSPRKPWEPLTAWVTGKLSTRGRQNRSPEEVLTAMQPLHYLPIPITERWNEKLSNFREKLRKINQQWKIMNFTRSL